VIPLQLVQEEGWQTGLETATAGTANTPSLAAPGAYFSLIVRLGE